MIKRFKDRAVAVKMLHIGLGSSFWYPSDVWFVLTGRVW